MLLKEIYGWTWLALILLEISSISAKRLIHKAFLRWLSGNKTIYEIKATSILVFKISKEKKLWNLSQNLLTSIWYSGLYKDMFTFYGSTNFK